jgi:hypothetical protein
MNNKNESILAMECERDKIEGESISSGKESLVICQEVGSITGIYDGK